MACTAAAYSCLAVSFTSSNATVGTAAAGSAVGEAVGDGSLELPQATAATIVTAKAPATQPSPWLFALNGSSLTGKLIWRRLNWNVGAKLQSKRTEQMGGHAYLRCAERAGLCTYRKGGSGRPCDDGHPAFCANPLVV